AVGAERQGRHPIPVPTEDEQLGPARRVPDPRRLVPRSGGEAPAVRGHGEADHIFVMPPVAGRLSGETAELPQGGTKRLFLMPLGAEQAAIGVQTPDPYRPVPGPGGDLLSIRRKADASHPVLVPLEATDFVPAASVPDACRPVDGPAPDSTA